MKKTASDKLSDRLVKAFLKNKIISPLPSRYTKKLIEADKFRKICESKINLPIIGFKAGGTALAPQSPPRHRQQRLHRQAAHLGRGARQER